MLQSTVIPAEGLFKLLEHRRTLVFDCSVKAHDADSLYVHKPIGEIAMFIFINCTFILNKTAFYVIEAEVNLLVTTYVTLLWIWEQEVY